MMNKPKSHDYIEQCPNCRKFLTALQAKNHQCETQFDVKEIPIKYCVEVPEENGDKTFIVHATDGKLYRLIQQKNPLLSDDSYHEPRNRRKVTRTNSLYI